jgi:hypothetical protein
MLAWVMGIDWMLEAFVGTNGFAMAYECIGFLLLTLVGINWMMVVNDRQQRLV